MSVALTPRKQAAAQQRHRADTYAAPVGGLNRRDSLVGQNPSDAWILDNFIARPFGVELREGFLRWIYQLPANVYTLMTYAPDRGDVAPSLSRFFAATDDGKIYNVTDPTAQGDPMPAASVTISGQAMPGRMSWTQFSAAGKNYLVVVAEGAGYWTYDSSGGWVQHTAGTGPGQITFPVGDTTTLADFAYVFEWHDRLCFIKKGSALVYYLDPLAIAGDLGVFDFGPQLAHGGQLEMAQSWTVDAGDGVDDKLVLVATHGDLLIYAGSDIADPANFAREGRWYVGEVPAGRRFMSRYGGDLTLICDRGVTYLSELLRGSGLFLQQQSAQGKLAPLIANDISHSITGEFWEIRYNLNEQFLMVNTPRPYCYVQETNSRSWSRFVGMPMTTMEMFGNELFFAQDDRVYRYGADAALDDIYYIRPGESLQETGGARVEGLLQTAWVAPEQEPFRKHIFHLVKPSFIAPSAPAVKLRLNVDWRQTSPPGAPGLSDLGLALWDVALWDVAVWSGGDNSFTVWSGVNGEGNLGALAMKVQGLPRTRFISWTLVSEAGGIL